MRIAVSSEGSGGLDALVSHHFGRCPFYTLVDVEDGRIGAVESVPNPHYPEHVPGVVPQFIHAQRASVMLTGGMGQRALAFFAELGIRPVTGATGSVREALAAYLGGEIDGAAPCRESAHDCGDGGTHTHAGDG